MSAFEEFLAGPYGWLSIFGIVLLFTALTILFYNRYDKYDPEPRSRLFYAFILGIVSVLPAIVLSFIAAAFVSFNELLLAVLIAPIVEEVCKIWFVIHLSKSIEFDGPLDGLIYGAMVGAGFAAAENVLYGIVFVFAGSLQTGIFISIIRSVTQIVGHPLYTGLAGVGVGEYKVGLSSSQYSKIWRSMGFHALWNTAASISSDLRILLIAISAVVLLNIIVLRRELHHTMELDREAYERGYYEEKKKFIEAQRQRIKDQIKQAQTGGRPDDSRQSEQQKWVQEDRSWGQSIAPGRSDNNEDNFSQDRSSNPVGIPEWEKDGWTPDKSKNDENDKEEDS